MLGLGSKLFTERQEDFEVGVGITNTCHWAYDSTMTGLGPESLMFLSEVPDKARGKISDRFQAQSGQRLTQS